MNLTATESSNVIIKEADLSTEMVNFASGRTGTYSIAGTDAALFNVVTASDGTTTFETQSPLNFVELIATVIHSLSLLQIVQLVRHSQMN